MFKQTTLSNKLKIISAPIPGSHGVTTAIFVKAGSRYETNKIAGISHFIEHMVFKGTDKRPSQSDISRAIEGIGGYLNAATSHDHTYFFNRVPARHAQTGFEVLSDMLNNSLLRPEDIKRESGVIVEELNMYRDTPTRYIYDLAMNLTWPNNPLGRDIIGTKQSITSVRRPDFTKYMGSMYQPQNMIVVAAGKVDHRQLIAQAKKYFAHQPNSRPQKFKPAGKIQAHPRVLLYPKDTDQVHLCFSLPALPHSHPDLPALTLLDIILGTGMSSRLFRNIREKRGLCYSISSFIERYEDTGLFGIYAGLNINKIEEAIIAILAEFKELTIEPVLKTELKEAKEFLRGTTLLQMDNTDSLANWYGTQGLFYKNIESPEQKIKKLLQVTENDIMKVAQRMLVKKHLNLTIIGPFKEQQKSKFLKLLINS